MDTPTIINVLIMIIMSLCGVVMAGVLYEIRKVRERLHKVEGSNASILTHINFVNQWLSDLKDVHVRLAKLETLRK